MRHYSCNPSIVFYVWQRSSAHRNCFHQTQMGLEMHLRCSYIFQWNLKRNRSCLDRHLSLPANKCFLHPRSFLDLLRPHSPCPFGPRFSFAAIYMWLETECSLFGPTALASSKRRAHDSRMILVRRHRSHVDSACPAHVLLFGARSFVSGEDRLLEQTNVCAKLQRSKLTPIGTQP